MKYRTIENQLIDEIVWKYYGNAPGCLEIVLENNPGLANFGAVLPSNIVIDLPNITPPKTKEKIRLWD